MGSQEASIALCSFTTAKEFHIPDPFQNIVGTLLEPIGIDSPEILTSLFQLSLVHKTDSRGQWLLQPNVTFPVVLEISTFQDGTINVRSSKKASILIMKKISCACPWEVEWKKKILRTNPVLSAYFNILQQVCETQNNCWFRWCILYIRSSSVIVVKERNNGWYH
jgi:hypothetical protein